MKNWKDTYRELLTKQVMLLLEQNVEPADFGFKERDFLRFAAAFGAKEEDSVVPRVAFPPPMSLSFTTSEDPRMPMSQPERIWVGQRFEVALCGYRVTVRCVR